jgi:hypothetical protein
MTEGTACAWKEAFIQDVINSPTNNFGSLKQFTVNLKKAFEASDAEEDAVTIPLPHSLLIPFFPLYSSFHQSTFLISTGGTPFSIFIFSIRTF